MNVPARCCASSSQWQILLCDELYLSRRDERRALETMPDKRNPFGLCLRDVPNVRTSLRHRKIGSIVLFYSVLLVLVESRVVMMPSLFFEIFTQAFISVRYNGSLDTCAYFKLRGMASGLVPRNGFSCLFNCVEGTILLKCRSKHFLWTTRRFAR